MGTVLPNENPCLAGTFTDLQNATSSDDCQSCPERYACLEGIDNNEYIFLLDFILITVLPFQEPVEITLVLSPVLLGITVRMEPQEVMNIRVLLDLGLIKPI